MLAVLNESHFDFGVDAAHREFNSSIATFSELLQLDVAARGQPASLNSRWRRRDAAVLPSAQNGTLFPDWGATVFKQPSPARAARRRRRAACACAHQFYARAIAPPRREARRIVGPVRTVLDLTKTHLLMRAPRACLNVCATARRMPACL
jgi:hypothetical protein